jgi:chromosome partitioning protein
MKKICITNQKGGSGKTSTAVLTALTLTAQGRRVLTVDCDPQGGLTAFLLNDEKDRRGLFDLLMGEQVAPIPINRGGLVFDILPADYRLDKIYASIGPFEMEKPFTNFNYDYIIFDTPPTVQGITRAAAIISDKIIIPADISQATIRPTLYTLSALKEIKKKGTVYIIGKAPDKTRHGYTADTQRLFIEQLGPAYGGTIQKGITVQKIIADRNGKWTPARIEKILKPILGAVQL